MKINLDYNEILTIVYMVLPKDYKEVSYSKEDENDINTAHLVFYSTTKNDKVLISFNNDHIEVYCRDNEIIENLHRAYVDFLCYKYPEINKEKQELVKTATEIAEKIKDTLINVVYDEGIRSLPKMLKEGSNYSLANALDYVRCGNHTTFIKIDNHYYRPDREINIGDVFSADLNPVVDAEYGGKRSVVIIGYDKEKANYVCVPCTTNPDGGFDIEHKTDKNLYAVTDKVKIISPWRLLKYRGHIKPEMLEKLKDEVKNSYAFFEDKEMDESFTSKISYNKAINQTRTIEQYILLYPIKKPSQEVIVDVMKKFAPTLEGYGMVINKKNGEIVYKCDSNFKHNTIITLNPKIPGEWHRYSPTEYDFSLFHVKRKRAQDDHWKYDKDFSIFYQKYMLERNPYYYIHLIRYLCEIEKMMFRKKNFANATESEDYATKIGGKLEEHFKELGFDYQGDFKELITNGVRGFDLSKLNYKELDDNYDELDEEIEDFFENEEENE